MTRPASRAQAVAAAKAVEEVLAVNRLVLAASRVPIVKRADREPFSTCLGCGVTDGLSCAATCWVLELERAIAGIGAMRRK